MLSQLVNRHKGISRVVNKIKNNDMPSTPTVKFKFNPGIHKNLSTNWNVPIDLSNENHKNNDNTNVKQENFSAIDFNKNLLDEGIVNNNNEHNKGNNKT